jgi:long-chain acyl-CoA synthetase
MFSFFTGLLSWFVSFTANTLDYTLFLLLCLIKGKKAVVPRDMQFASVRKSVLKQDATDVKPGESKPYRHPDFVNSKELPVSLIDLGQGKVTTVPELIRGAVAKYAKKPMLGTRKLLQVHAQGKLLTYEFEPQITWQTYEQVDKRIDHIAAGIVHMTGLNSTDRFAIFENTNQEWFMTAQALMRYNITLVTVYATLGDDALVHALSETQVTSILVNESSLVKFKTLAKQVPTLKNIIYVPEKKTCDAKAANDLQETHKYLKVVSFEELEQLGAQQQNTVSQVRQVATPDSLAIIMYTSGTTGEPKGVMITQRNIVSAIGSIHYTIELEEREDQHVYLAYLPLAHILEFCAEHFIVMRGGRIGYGTPRTLSDRTTKPQGDLKAVGPTLFAGVPRVFDTIKKGILELVNDPSQTSWIKKWIFHVAFQAKKNALHNQRDTPLWNKLVFDKLRQQIGGNVVLLLSGGAALNRETQEFLRVCFGQPTVQGYGLTETTACISVQAQVDRWTPLSTGRIQACAEVKLVSVPDMNYTVNDQPCPRGEIVARGPMITLGYFNQPEKTKADFREDGWFHTGDIGQINPDGSLSVIDRKKNLIKLDTGEYVALEKLESIYNNCPFVSPVYCLKFSHLVFRMVFVYMVTRIIAIWLPLFCSNPSTLCNMPRKTTLVQAMMISRHSAVMTNLSRPCWRVCTRRPRIHICRELNIFRM